MMSTMRATMEAPTPTPTCASRGNVDWAWLSYCTFPREKFRFPIFTWKRRLQTTRLEELLVTVQVQIIKKVNSLCVTGIYSEFRQTVHAILLPAGCDRRLLGWWFTVQVVVRQGLHQTQTLPDPSLHLLLVHRKIQELALKQEDCFTFY